MHTSTSIFFGIFLFTTEKHIILHKFVYLHSRTNMLADFLTIFSKYKNTNKNLSSNKQTMGGNTDTL